LAAAPSLADQGIVIDDAYLRAEGGLSLSTDMGASGSAGLNFTQKPDNSYIAGGAIGLRMTPFRVELGVDVMSRSSGSVQFTNDAGLGARLGLGSLNGTTRATSGTIRDIPMMANILYDFHTGSRWTPYVGIGIGADILTAQNISVGGQRIYDTSQIVFAYQPTIGVNYALDDNDQFEVGLAYRYFGTTDATLRDTAGHQFSIQSASHNFLASLTYYFGPREAAAAPALAPPPPATVTQPRMPPAVAPPATAREFIVYFDFDKSTLTTPGRKIVDDAVNAYKTNRSQKVELRGYTDEVGSDSYNLELSRKRAMTVHDYMAKNGVSDGDMNVSWHGKQDPRVPTEQREQQNRRVEISM
jgi:outer membrane protein OmpA-like peptidoglycan-associated protein